MPVITLDHVNIRTADVAGTAAFFRDVLDLRAGPAPGASSMEVACWIFDPAGRPIIHIGGARTPYPSDGAYPFAPAEGTGPVHHIAFECEDHPAVAARLDAAGMVYTINDFPAIGLTQLFVAEPNGILLELNFRPPR